VAVLPPDAGSTTAAASGAARPGAVEGLRVGQVLDARIDARLGGERVQVTADGRGFEARLAQAPRPGARIAVQVVQTGPPVPMWTRRHDGR